MSELWGSLFRLIEQQSKPVQIAAALILVVCVGVPTGVTLAKKFAHVDELVTPGPHSVVNVATESTPYKDGPLLAPRGNYETPDSARANDQKVAAAGMTVIPEKTALSGLTLPTGIEHETS